MSVLACRYLHLWQPNPNPGHLLPRRASTTRPFQLPRHTVVASPSRSRCRMASDKVAAMPATSAHFVFVPLMHHGHLIPAVDAALQLATHGAKDRATPTYTAPPPMKSFAGAARGAPADSPDRTSPDPARRGGRYLSPRRPRPAERHIPRAAATCIVSDIRHP
ncbi:hypothetical protein ZWY2020_054121 [Hordeum vulgare]|nr:hypothetical protein ZWY2020_054121 [Hordeum vulgare]